MTLYIYRLNIQKYGDQSIISVDVLKNLFLLVVPLPLTPRDNVWINKSPVQWA